MLPTRASQGVLFLALLSTTLRADDPADELVLGARAALGEALLQAGCAAEAILTASNTVSGDRLGKSVAFYGETAVVGAPRDTRSGGADAGSAYVFVRQGTTWIEEQQLIPSDAALDDRFGWAAALWGDTAVVGAYLEDHGGLDDAGAAYVFVRSGTTWVEEQKLTASDGASDDRFGFSVAIWQDTIVVGAFRDDGANIDLGSAYVFVRNGTTWTEEQKLVAGDGMADDRLGVAVAIEGDTALIGAYRDNLGNMSNAGSAYVFVRSGTTWSQQQKLVASDGKPNDNFGRSVALSGETALAGAPVDGNTLSANTQPGAAYVFVRNGTSWSEQQKLVASDGLGGDALGQALDLSGDTAALGAPRDDHASSLDVGSAYVFTRSGTTWSQQQKLFPDEGFDNDYFGLAIATAGDTVVVGVPRDDHSDESDAGSVQVFRICPVVVPYCTAGFSASGCQATLTASGLPSVGAPTGFLLMASNAEGAKDGAFYFGTSGQQANPWGNGTSFQCVVAPVQRTGLLNGTGTVGLCDGSFTRDLNAFWCPSCTFSSKAPSPGTLVQAQLWYRDPANTSSKKTSLSNAIEFCVTP